MTFLNTSLRILFAAYTLFMYAALALFILGLLALFVPSLHVRSRILLLVPAWTVLGSATFVTGYYVWEVVETLMSQNRYEIFTFWHARAGGPYAWAYWLNLLLLFVPQLLWFPRYRRRPLPLTLIAGVSLLPFAVSRIGNILHG